MIGYDKFNIENNHVYKMKDIPKHYNVTSRKLHKWKDIGLLHYQNVGNSGKTGFVTVISGDDSYYISVIMGLRPYITIMQLKILIDRIRKLKKNDKITYLENLAFRVDVISKSIDVVEGFYCDQFSWKSGINQLANQKNVLTLHFDRILINEKKCPK
jgi:hypothetical protein